MSDPERIKDAVRNACEFREFLANVTPLPALDRHLPARRPIEPIARQRMIDEKNALFESLTEPQIWDSSTETGEELLYRRTGISRQVINQLRKGKWTCQAELDLHGYPAAAAHERVTIFLDDCAKRAYRCVRIVHGKGLRSPNREPVLKARISGWLNLRDDVLGFCQARPADGGGGALMVLLRGGPKT